MWTAAHPCEPNRYAVRVLMVPLVIMVIHLMFNKTRTILFLAIYLIVLIN